jgi:hypothetical protein
MKLRLSLLVALAGAVSVSASAQTPRPPEPQWAADCRAGVCQLRIDIAHGDATPQRIARLSVSVKQSTGAIAPAMLSLPPDADPGKTLTVGFADAVLDPLAQLQIKVVSSTVQIYKVAVCNAAACPVELIGANSPGALEFGRNMLKHDRLVFVYFVNGERVRGSTPLSAFQDQYKQLAPAAR